MPRAAANVFIVLLTALLRISTAGGLLIPSADLLPQQSVLCSNFTGGTGFHSGFFTFTTPNYPNNYPKSADCFKIIRAAYHQIVKLDFRDKFFIERSSRCNSDFLEIRDGPYGYSPPLSDLPRDQEGRVCGPEPPRGPPLKSTGRYLWLRFKSDTTIEHQGMQAVYSFEQSASIKQECRLELSLPVDRQEVLTTKQLKEKFPQRYLANQTLPVDCSIDASSTPENTKIFVSLESIQVRRDDACEQHAMEFYDGFTAPDLQRELAKICKTTEANYWTRMSATKRVVIRVTSRDAYLMPKFVVVLTVVRMGSCDPGTEFDCGSDQCIDSRLVCNTHVNCPDGKDELNCQKLAAGHGHGGTADTEDKKATDKDKLPSDKKPAEVSYHPIILGSIGAGFLALTLACCCVTLKQRMRERRAGASAAAAAAVAAVETDGHDDVGAGGGGRRPPLSRGPSQHLPTGGDAALADSPMLPPPGQTVTGVMHPDGATGLGTYAKQNGILGAAPGACGRPPYHQQMPAPPPPLQAQPQPMVTPSRVRVGKFLDPTGDCEPDSPIVEIFGADCGPYSA